MCRLAQIEYRDQIQKAEDERKELLEKRRKEKYEKHYDICQQVICLVDIYLNIPLILECNIVVLGSIFFVFKMCLSIYKL